MIGDFFTHWLAEGKIENQLPKPSKPKAKWSCTDAEKYVFGDPDKHWRFQNGRSNQATTFFMILLRELGSAGHLDRLTIFKARANGMKGGVSL